MADLFGQFPFVLTSASAAVDECFPSGIQLGRGQVLIPAVNEALKQTNNNDLLEKYGGTKNCIYKD